MKQYIRIRMSGAGKRSYVAGFDYRDVREFRKKSEKLLFGDFSYRFGRAMRSMSTGEIYSAIADSYRILETWSDDVRGEVSIAQARMDMLDAAGAVACEIIDGMEDGRHKTA